MNKVILTGRTTANPEIKIAGSVNVCGFTLAVDRPTKAGSEPVTDFIDCIAWDKTADFLVKYAPKGTKLLIEGSIQVESYVDKDGKRRRATKVRVDKVEFAGPKVNAGGNKENTEDDDDKMPF